MKKFLNMLFIASIIIACNVEKKRTLEERIAIENQSTEIIDTIFLDYCLGMTEDQFVDQTKQYLKSNKVRWSDGLPVYNTKIGNVLKAEVDITYTPKFHQGKLYRMTLFVNSISDMPYGGQVIATALSSDIAHSYWTKGFLLETESIDEECDICYTLFKNNLVIEIKEGIISDAQVEYLDKPICNLIITEQDESDRQEKINRAKDF